MNAQTKIEAVSAAPSLARLREPFAPHHISKKPAPTKSQNDAVKADYKKGIRCPECSGWHHPDVVHLDYVGHAALTDRLLDVDIEWDWEPLAYDPKGLPMLDDSGGLWIRLTVLGKSRLGYGSADGKQGGNAIKELIGDALRNAAMRFGAALDLWHKGDLHADEGPADDAPKGNAQQASDDQGMPDHAYSKIASLLQATNTAPGTLLEHYRVRNLRLLNEQQYDEVVDRLEARLAQMAKADTNRAGRADDRSADQRSTAAGEFGDLADDDIPF